MKVFVVGGNGFLGRQLVASLISKEVNTDLTWDDKEWERYRLKFEKNVVVD